MDLETTKGFFVDQLENGSLLHKAGSDGKAILFIDEIHRLKGAGTYKGNLKGDVFQKLKEFLLEETTYVIGATTPHDAEEMFEDKAIMRRFNQVEGLEVTPKECKAMLEQTIQMESFRKPFPGVTFAEGTIEYAIQLTDKDQEPTVGQPDRAKDLILKAARQVVDQDDKCVTEKTIATICGVDLS